MEKRLKIGIYCMLAAVILLPVAILTKNVSEILMFSLLFLTMLLELIGLIFVLLSVIRKKAKS
ncbi:MAG: hypothetical protein EOO87_12655 [Pedobacter sp.]|nr:MAG: hypothetical protein EOO87_12655 [Pedobacter sp.]